MGISYLYLSVFAFSLNEDSRVLMVGIGAELMLLGFISLLLTVFQNMLTKFCVPKEVMSHLLPCKPPEENHVTHNYGLWQRAIGRHLLSSESSSSSCSNGVSNPLYFFFLFLFYCFSFIIQSAPIWNLGRIEISVDGKRFGDALHPEHSREVFLIFPIPFHFRIWRS